MISKTILPSLFAWIIFNYYNFNLEDVFEEIDLFNLNLFSNYRTKKNLNKKLNNLIENSKNELEMVTKEENNRLMNKIDDHLNDKFLIDKFKIETIDKLIENDFLKIKFNQLILNENLFLKNLINDKSINLIENVSFKNQFIIIYTQLAESIFYSHHFYLIYDLYTIRTSLSTDLYSIVSIFLFCLILFIFFFINNLSKFSS